MPIAYKTTEDKAAAAVFELMESSQKFDVRKFIEALRDHVISEHKAAVRHPQDFTPEEYEFWEEQAYAIKGRL